MLLTLKFRLYPSGKQEEKLLWTLDMCRFVYNEMLSGLSIQEKPNRLKLQSLIPKLQEKFPELKQVYSKLLQYEVYRLFSNLKVLGVLKKNGKKVGKLRFKGKKWFKSFTFNQSGFKVIETKKRCQSLHLSKIGEISIRMHRNIKGYIKQVTIKKHCSGKWFACFSVTQNERIERKPVRKSVGLDLGLKHFVVDSENKFIDHPRCLDKSLKKLKREHKWFSRKEEYSWNRAKQRANLAIIHEKICNQRLAFLHKLSRQYIDNYDFIAAENLNIKNLISLSFNARNLMDASWNKFLSLLSYKAASAGKIMVKVDPRNTSQKCSNCGRKVKKSLAVRIHNCSHCGLRLDRDYNAALNILKLGFEKLPQGLREVTPVDIRGKWLKQEAPI